jgi:hypothetical protein
MPGTTAQRGTKCIHHLHLPLFGFQESLNLIGCKRGQQGLPCVQIQIPPQIGLPTSLTLGELNNQI